MKPKNLIALVFLLSGTLEVSAQQTKQSIYQSEQKKRHSRVFGKLYLGQNVPNPVKVNQSTTIPFRSAAAVDAKIIVFSSEGEAVITFEELIGKENVTIDGGQLLPGNYMYCLFVAGRVVKKKKFQIIPEG